MFAQPAVFACGFIVNGCAYGRPVDTIDKLVFTEIMLIPPVFLNEGAKNLLIEFMLGDAVQPISSLVENMNPFMWKGSVLEGRLFPADLQPNPGSGFIITYLKDPGFHHKNISGSNTIPGIPVEQDAYSWQSWGLWLLSPSKLQADISRATRTNMFPITNSTGGPRSMWMLTP